MKTPTSVYSPTYTNGMSDRDFAAALAAFQPCNDCTATTETTIPHHHHPPGRLAGASATLDGHFCCSWMLYGQPCFLCFESAEALDNHIKNDHAGKDGTYRCLWQDCFKQDDLLSTPDAGSNFGNKPKLMRHVHSHTGYKPFPCPHTGCGKGFITKEQLKNHETTHTKSRKYQCKHCGKAFAVKSALTTHITAVHDEKKIHSCDMCGKAFADSSNLSKHKQTHFRASGVRKQRQHKRRASSSVYGGRSTPSITTPISVDTSRIVARGMMGPPATPLPSNFSPYPPFDTSYSSYSMSTPSSLSSPPPQQDLFDPDCYCCDQLCCPPPVIPCEQTVSRCDREGFCNLDVCSPAPCTVYGDTCCDLPVCSPRPCAESEHCAVTVGEDCPAPEFCVSEVCCDLPDCLQLSPSPPPIFPASCAEACGERGWRQHQYEDTKHEVMEHELTNLHAT